MEITAIGVGNAFSKINFNQCYMLEENGNRMLIDFGRNVPEALHYHKIDIKTIDSVYISHKHGDHIAGLECLALSRYDWLNKPASSKKSEVKYAPKLIGNELLLKELWNECLKGGLETMEGFTATIETFFDTAPVAPNGHFEWEGWSFSLIQQIHIMSGSIISPTFGLMMTKEGYETIYFTTDSQHCSPRQMEIFYKNADIIIQDCEISPFFSGVHANYIQLAGFGDSNSIDVGKDIRKKMYLSHYQDVVTQDLKPLSKFSQYEFYREGTDKPNELIEFDWEGHAKSCGFKGFMKLGEVIKPAPKS